MSPLPREDPRTGIDPQLYDSHSHRMSRRSKHRPAPIRESRGHGEALARLIAQLPACTSGRLATIDPYHDTVLNEQAARPALRETPALLDHGTDDARAEAVPGLATCLKDCSTTPGSYLALVGG
ncbi:hypothetical protein [Streptomyces sp. NPDC007905]|uniref:hypothetical protein n=1 Tax=Streptomyces sp. NPDC007905 TaxID=3364788 RepID=UPI0036F04948